MSSIEKNARDIQLLREALHEMILGCKELVQYIQDGQDDALDVADININNAYRQRLKVLKGGKNDS